MQAAALPFLPNAATHDLAAPALCDDHSDAWLTYGELAAKIEETSAFLHSQQRGLVLCCLPRTCSGVIAYLAAAQAGQAIALADPEAPNVPNIIATYAPAWIITPDDTNFDGYEPITWNLSPLRLFKKSKPQDLVLHPDFYLMLLTSGSTGSSKGVRLSYKNIATNTQAIIKSLNLSNAATALCHLPLAYSFGLSILHMQLAVGGRTVLTQESMMSEAFWNLARTQNVTLFAGVPYHYEMLMRLGLARLKLPSLRTFLQAGGKMPLPLTQKMLDEVRARPKGEMFIMYGQTETSPRISCFPLHQRPEKIGSSGTALEGTTITIENGEIIVKGPNVMMGPATSPADLALGDVTGGRLATGDLGSLDAEGFLTITGRAQRFAKLFGQRMSLDDLEKIASAHAVAVAIEHPEKVVLFCLKTDTATMALIKDQIVDQTKIPAPWIELQTLDEIPHKANGKIDYQALRTRGTAT
ncbi:MAG: AMP-binding protein [Alphaproteobacteria bacterium]|nr:AMP-binding protein [Alphaproteobacteria bacterium]